MESHKFAAIDIGSNAVRLLFMQVFPGQPVRFKKTSLIRVPLRLGQDVFKNGCITDHNMDRLINTLMGFGYLIEAHDIQAYSACATSAMREAQNGAQAVERIAAECGIVVDVISGRREAQIIYSSQIAQKVDPEHSSMFVDVGGGSVEMTLFAGGKAHASESFQIGTVRMIADTIEEDEWNRLKTWVKESTAREKPHFLIGSGGNINKMIRLIKDKKSGDKIIKRKELSVLYDELSALTLEERMLEFNLNPDRADVIIPACKIFKKILYWSGSKEVFVPKAGLADGICRQLYREFAEGGRMG